MSAWQQIIDSVHGLDASEKRVLRDLLDRELSAGTQHPAGELPPIGSALTSNPMIGLLADEPELADQILRSAMLARQTRPLRMPGDEVAP